MSSLPAQKADQVFDAGSFRDRHGRVYYRNRDVLRALSAEALQEWNALDASRFFHSLIGEGRIVQTAIANEQPPEGWAAVLQHERIPFLSYPYEWTFGMLKDAALLQLRLLQESLNEGFILKDCSGFNFQWKGAQPVFIDILSFKKMEPGEVWAGYRQFCQMFLYPMMLQAYKHIPFQSRLRGDVEGISPAEMNHILEGFDRFRPGVFAHVFLQSKLQQSMGQGSTDVKSELKNAGFAREMILSNVKRLHNLVQKLEWNPSGSEWADYTRTTSYTDQDAELKFNFVKLAVNSRRWTLAWDLGCNKGQFAKLAAGQADCVVAMDADHLVVERLYQELKQENVSNILPLVMSLADASPGLGWRGTERKALTERGAPDLILCLALIHHMVISANIPLQDFVNWLADQARSLVIEFVTREDPMVRKLLMNKQDQYSDYHVDVFERCLASRYRIVQKTALPAGTRILYFAES